MQAAQAKVRALADGAGDFKGLCRRARASAMVADVEIDQEIDGARRGSVPFHLADVIDDGHRASGGDARDLRRIAERRRQQNAGNGVGGHQFGFRDGRDRDSACAMRDLTAGDFDALVRLGMRAKLLAGLFHRLRHARKVGFQKIGIEQQRGRGDLIFGEHRFEL